MPGHSRDLDRLIGILSTPKAPDAAEGEILELRKDICKLLGHFGMELVRYGSRYPCGKGAATQVLHEHVRLAKGLFHGRFEVEDLGDRDSGIPFDDFHRSNLTQHRGSILVVEGSVRDPNDPKHIV